MTSEPTMPDRGRAWDEHLDALDGYRILDRDLVSQHALLVSGGGHSSGHHTRAVASAAPGTMAG